MVAFNKYYGASKDAWEGKHNLAADAVKVALSNTAPDLTDVTLADASEIAAGNGYVAGGNAAALASSSQALGVYSAKFSDPAAFVAAGGSIGPFRYAVIYNATSNRVIGWYDYGSSITLQDGETFTVDLSQTTGLFTNT